jgi:hypothetical protein
MVNLYQIICINIRFKLLKKNLIMRHMLPMRLQLNILNKYHINVYAFILCTIIFLPSIVLSNDSKIIGWANIQTKNLLRSDNNANSNNSAGLQLTKQNKNVLAKITLNIKNNKYINFDDSYVNYNFKNSYLGFGKTNRNWSFSNRTSLILSENSRPHTALYFGYKSNKDSRSLISSVLGPWSFEIFNSTLSNLNRPKNPMLLGMRATSEPFTNLKFELVKTSQWGGKGYSPSLSQFNSAIIGNTNENENENINQMGGIGFSYLTSINKYSLRTYGQLIGEDEAGNLPTCFMYLLGAEQNLPENLLIDKFGLEIVDTRVDFTTNGYCGPNTAYNNHTYSYTNCGKVLGAPIDTEGKSIEFWGMTQLSENLEINYSIKNILINDTNWSNHRLSSSRQKGWLSNLATSYKKNNYTINSVIIYQGFSLDKQNINNGLGLEFKAMYNF